MFRTLPTFPLSNKLTDDQITRMEMVKTATKEFLRIRAKQRIPTAMRSKAPPSAKYIIKSGGEILGCIEKEQTWVPKLGVMDRDTRSVCVNTGQRVIKLHISTVLAKIDD